MIDCPGPLYLGVDAGNSKTVAVLADSSGAVLGYGRGGCGDIYGAATESLAVAEVVGAVRRALLMASSSVRSDGDPSEPIPEPIPETIPETAIAHAAFCLAGIDWPADEVYWHEQLATWLPGLSSYSLRNDGFALLRAGEPAGLGVALSAGTGGAIVARGPAGHEWSASMWIVDALGGAALGEQAYAAVVRAELGVSPPTALREALLSRHGFDDVASLLEASTSRGALRLRHAALARDVLDAASAGDPVAAAIVHRQADGLAQYAVAAARHVSLTGPQFPVVLGGSVMSSANPALRNATRESVTRLMTGARVTLAPRSPVVGAVAEAIAEGSPPLTPQVLHRLSSYGFPVEFLLT